MYDPNKLEVIRIYNILYASKFYGVMCVGLIVVMNIGKMIYQYIYTEMIGLFFAKEENNKICLFLIKKTEELSVKLFFFLRRGVPHAPQLD